MLGGSVLTVGRNNQRRRAAKQQLRHQRGPTPPAAEAWQPRPDAFWFESGPAPGEVRREQVEQVLTRLLRAAASSPATLSLALERELAVLTRPR